MSENTGYMHPEALVDAQWVQAHLADPAVRLIEVDVDTTACTICWATHAFATTMAPGRSGAV